MLNNITGLVSAASEYAAWLAAAPLDMRAGTETALARVVAVFGAAHPHHAYLNDVFTRLPTQRASQIGELLPHRWQTPQPTHA